MANNSILSPLLLLLLLTMAATTSFAAKDVPEGEFKPASSKTQDEPYKVVNDFCNRRKSRQDREFCARVFISDPRSATAKDNATLLLISVDLAAGDLTRTRDYYAELLFKSSRSTALVLALKDCLPAYGSGIEELDLIPTELRKGPAFAAYDAKNAHDDLQRCTHSLKQHKISNNPVLVRHTTSTNNVQLCVDISLVLLNQR